MIESKTRTWQKIGVFYALTLILTPPYWYLVSGGDDVILWTGSMWSPALAAILTKWIFGERVREMGWQWGGDRYFRLSYLIPPPPIARSLA